MTLPTDWASSVPTGGTSTPRRAEWDDPRPDGGDRSSAASNVPVVLSMVDVGPWLDPAAGESERREVARQLDQACRRFGFVRISGHGVDSKRRASLTSLAHEFFALPEATKAEVAMSRGGAAWRGWFPVGDELTSGRPDGKEGLYFGEELSTDHPRVRAGTPLHGPNLFPATPPELGAAVVAWMQAMTALGQSLLAALATGLGLPEPWFADHVTDEPTTLFRIFHYPPHPGGADDWGVREHTDYGLLTILAQDGTGGLEVRAPDGWIAVPADPDVFVVNLGDMLERMTKGLYRSTPHRVRNTSDRGRLSMPFFLDPSWDAEVTPMPVHPLDPTDTSMGRPRWDGADVHAWQGTYGEYLTAKVTKVFPHLKASLPRSSVASSVATVRGLDEAPGAAVGLDRIETFADGLDHPEGIAVTQQGQIFVGGEAGQIYRIESDDSFTIVADTGGFILGLSADADARLYAIDTVHKCVWRVEPDSGTTTVFARGPDDQAFRTPNWGAFDALGNYYLTDSGTWGGGDGLIWRIPPGRPAEVWHDGAVDFPNGCAVSPDGTTLFYVESLPGRICRIDIDPDGSAGMRTVLCELGDTVPDGVAITDDGALIIACYRPDVIHRWHPDDGLSVIAFDPRGTVIAAPTNVAFAGPDRSLLVVPNLGRWHLSRGRFGIRGVSLHYPTSEQLGG